MSLVQPFSKAPLVKPLINIGAGFDIVTGTWLLGKYGESILNGGQAHIEGITGRPNNFKSTIQRYKSFRAAARMRGSTGSSYDTETNMHESHQEHLANGIEEFEGELVFDTGRWVLTTKVEHDGDDWYDKFKTYITDKVKNAKDHKVELPFLDRDGETLMTSLVPTFTDVDSLTQFDTAATNEIQEKNGLSDSGANMLYMKGGLGKKRLMSEAPRLNIMANNYISFTAHLGPAFNIAQGGPPGAQPTKQLKFLGSDEKIKGVSDGFLTLTQNLWYAYNANPMVNQGTKSAEYPKDGEDNLQYDTDLTLVSLKNLRSKSGVSGIPLQIIVSQQDGVLPSLSEFHYLKENGRYGFEGNDRNYSLVFLPNIKMQRTTIRGIIDRDPQVRRALNILMEMCQMENLWNAGMGDEVKCTPKELYDGLIQQGFNWDVLLNTRGWWTYNNAKHPIPFLSSMDLLRLHKGLYFPFWMDEKTKDVKDEYRRQYME